MRPEIGKEVGSWELGAGELTSLQAQGAAEMMALHYRETRRLPSAEGHRDGRRCAVPLLVPACDRSSDHRGVRHISHVRSWARLAR
jgi:hypothetical protein